MGSAFWLLIAAIVLFAAFLLAHLALVARILRSDLPVGWKWASLIPLVTPVAAWKAERRVGLIVWAVFLIGYAVVWLMAPSAA